MKWKMGKLHDYYLDEPYKVIDTRAPLSEKLEAKAEKFVKLWRKGDAKSRVEMNGVLTGLSASETSAVVRRAERLSVD